MTVHDQAHAENAVENGVVRAARGKGGDRKRDEAGGENTLKRPVVGAMGLGGRRERSGVVHGAPVDGCYATFQPQRIEWYQESTHDRQERMQRPPHPSLQRDVSTHI